ncbi:MAG TPA: FmdE family protein [Desulfosalsimonadaceae bacterium]|nr:FmdE family protein [Desulfosalsimonadaceae bacterium]
MCLSEQRICGKTWDEFLETIQSFHGFPAPGLVLGSFMVDLAKSLIGQEVEADAIVETRHCLPDAVQIFTPCTIGNGWMKIMDWDKFALTLYDRHNLDGYRVWFDLEKAKAFPDLYNWYMRLVPKKDLPISVLLEVLSEAGHSVLSYTPVKVTNYYTREKKKTINICAGCGEAYPAWQGALCRACQGEGYYGVRADDKKSPPLAANTGNSGGDGPELRKVPVEQAVGKRLTHDITEIRKGEFKGRAFKKGHEIRHEDICHFHRLGKQHVYIEEIESAHIHENEAAERMANAFCGPGVTWQGEPVEGKLKLYAKTDGLLKVSKTALADINMLGEVMCATRHTHTMMKAGDIVAATRAIPLLVRKEVVDRAVEIAAAASGLIDVKPLNQANVGIIITGNEVYHQIIEDQFEAILRSKVTELGSNVADVSFAPDDADKIADIIRRYLADGVDLILTSGGMSVDPDDVTRMGVVKAGGEAATYGSPVLPGAMFMVAYIEAVPVLGVPACGIYHKTTMLDLILPRVLAGDRLDRSEIAEMGHGGLCLDCEICRFPDCPFGK